MNSLAWAEMVQMDPQTTLPVPVAVAVAAHTLKIPTFLYRFLLPSPRPEFGRFPEIGASFQRDNLRRRF
jgi:hypothetical protein